MFVTYFQNTKSVTKRTRENIQQQVSILADNFKKQYQDSLERSLEALITSPTLNDYLLGSVAEKLVIGRRLEKEYLRYLNSYPFIQSISFIDDSYKVAISVKNGVRRSGQIDLSKVAPAEMSKEWSEVLQLYDKLKSIPLLLFSGNMEWFMPPRDAQVVGPFTNVEGETFAAIGQSKLDTDTGTFGGVVIIHFTLDQWIGELKQVRFFNESPIWLFSTDQIPLIKPEKDSGEFDPRMQMNDDETSKVELLDTAEGLIAYNDLSLGPQSQFVRLAASIPKALLLLDLHPVIEFFTAILIVSIGIMTFISYWVSRYLSQPVTALQTTQNRLANAQRIARLGHWEWEIDSTDLTISDHARAILGLESGTEKLSLKKFIECVSPAQRNTLSDAIQRVISTQRSVSIEHTVIQDDGKQVYVCQDLEIEGGAKNLVVGTIQDISLRKRNEQKIRRLAFYDTITGLANRTRLIQLGSEAIVVAKPLNNRVAFIFLDLDHFKRINDTYGHDAGDELLRQVANRLKHCIRLQDTLGRIPESDSTEKTVARLGGDEFIILLTQLEQLSDVVAVAERVNEQLKRKFSIAGKDVFISGSLGISLYPDNGENVDDLLRHADAAMYHAKKKGRNRYEFFTESIERDIKHRLDIETRLHQALENGEFTLHYQPRIQIETGQIVAVEALIRWENPDVGLIYPNQFVPVAEETGLIIPIGEWVLLEACQQLAKWNKQLSCHISMSINLSPIQFNLPNLMNTFLDALQESNIDPKWIEFELTENALYENLEASILLANEFKAMGVRLSIDDFGTGYSSLQQLKQFPVDILKIDRLFIQDILTDIDDALIVKTAIGLGHNLRLKVVAEGVESSEQLAFLKENRCDQAQGDFFSKAQPATDITCLLLDNSQPRN